MTIEYKKTPTAPIDTSFCGWAVCYDIDGKNYDDRSREHAQRQFSNIPMTQSAIYLTSSRLKPTTVFISSTFNHHTRPVGNEGRRRI